MTEDQLRKERKGFVVMEMFWLFLALFGVEAEGDRIVCRSPNLIALTIGGCGQRVARELQQQVSVFERGGRGLEHLRSVAFARAQGGQFHELKFARSGV